MNTILVDISGGVGRIPLNAILTYDGHGHLDMEGTHTRHIDGVIMQVHPLTISLRDDSQVERDVRYRLMSYTKKDAVLEVLNG